MIKNTNVLTVYEVDGVECMSDRPGFIVESHPVRDQMIVIIMQDGRRYTVSARDIEAAVKNAINTARF